MNARLIPCWITAAILAGCAGGAVAPRWKAEAAGELETYRNAALAGSATAARTAYRHALASLKQGGDIPGLARMALTRCAIERITAAKQEGCAEYRALGTLASSPELDAYAHWLDGNLAADEVARLPEAYREIARLWQSGAPPLMSEALLRVEPPLSFLLALSITGERLATPLPAWEKCQSISAREGWVAAHLACLKRESQWREARGDAAGALILRRKIGVLTP